MKQILAGIEKRKTGPIYLLIFDFDMFSFFLAVPMKRFNAQVFIV